MEGVFEAEFIVRLVGHGDRKSCVCSKVLEERRFELGLDRTDRRRLSDHENRDLVEPVPPINEPRGKDYSKRDAQDHVRILDRI